MASQLVVAARTAAGADAGRLGWKVRSSWVIWSAEIGLEK